MSLSSSSYRRITTIILPQPPSIFKTLHSSPPSSIPILRPKLQLKSFTVHSSTPSSPNPTLQHHHLPQNLQQIINLFQSVQHPKAKYEQLLFYAKNLKPLHPIYKTEANKVKGCVSQVWLRAYLDDKNVIFEADSDALITKGLAALLVQGFSGCSVEEIVRVSPDFIGLLGLQQSLSPSRNNGFLNMFEMMQKKALMLYVEAEKGTESRIGDVKDVENVESLKTDVHSGSTSFDYQSSGDDLNTNGSVLGSRGERIREILYKELEPVELEVEDVSYQHAGHAGVKGNNGETHFNLKVVSKEFEGKSLVKRHRLIYSLLDNELQSGLHALSIDAKTPAEVGV